MDPGRSSVGLVYACITHKLGAAVKRNNLNSYTWGHGESGRLGHGIDQNGRGLNQDVWSPKVVDELRRCGCHVTQVQSHIIEQSSFCCASHVTFHSPIILFTHSSSVFYGTPACSSENRHWRSVGVGQWIEGPARPRILVHSQHISPQQNAAALTFCRLSYQSESIFPPSLFARLQLSF